MTCVLRGSGRCGPVPTQHLDEFGYPASRLGGTFKIQGYHMNAQSYRAKLRQDHLSLNNNLNSCDENVIFRTRDEGTSILGERHNAGNTCRRRGRKRSPVYGGWTTRKCNWILRKWLKSVSKRQEKVAPISVQHSQEEKTDQCLIQGEGNGKPLLWECCLVHPQGSPGVLQTMLCYNGEKDQRSRLKWILLPAHVKAAYLIDKKGQRRRMKWILLPPHVKAA